MEEEEILDDALGAAIEHQLMETNTIKYIERVKSIQLVVISVFVVGGLLAWWFYLFVFEIMYRQGIFASLMGRRGDQIEGVLFIGMTVMIISATLTTGYLGFAFWKYRKFLKNATRVDWYQRANEFYTLFWKWFTVPAIVGATIAGVSMFRELWRVIFGSYLF